MCTEEQCCCLSKQVQASRLVRCTNCLKMSTCLHSCRLSSICRFSCTISLFTQSGGPDVVQAQQACKPEPSRGACSIKGWLPDHNTCGNHEPSVGETIHVARKPLGSNERVVSASRGAAAASAAVGHEVSRSYFTVATPLQQLPLHVHGVPGHSSPPSHCRADRHLRPPSPARRWTLRIRRPTPACL